MARMRISAVLMCIYLLIHLPGGLAHAQGMCLICDTQPDSETTVSFSPGFNQEATTTNFIQTVFDFSGTNYNGYQVEEENAFSPSPTDTCHFLTSTIPQYSGVSSAGIPWTIGGPGTFVHSLDTNEWGTDEVGWFKDAVLFYQSEGPPNGVPLPCGFVGYQVLNLICNETLDNLGQYNFPYDLLTADIDQRNVTNCRGEFSGSSACGTIDIQ